MSMRRKANRAEVIVRGVGAIILLLLLFTVIQVLPQILKGKDPRETVSTMMQIVLGVAAFGVVVGVAGLLVWLRVLRGKRKKHIQSNPWDVDSATSLDANAIQRAKHMPNTLDTMLPFTSVKRLTETIMW